MDKAESSCNSSASSVTRYEDDLNEIKAIINLGGRPPPQTHITVNPPPDIIPPNGHIKELTNQLQHALYEKERYKNALSAAERSHNLQHHEQFEKLLMKIAQLEKINKTKTDSSDVLIELDSIKTELNVKTRNNEHLQTELRELHETCNFKTACITELKNKIANQHVELQIAHQKHNDTKRSETNLTNEINHSKKQLDWYKEQMIIKNQLINEVITLKSSVASKTVEIENLNAKILQTKQLQQSESCKELLTIKNELSGVKSTLQSKTIEIEKLKTELIDWKSKYSDTQLILNEQFQTDDYKQCTKEDDYKKLYELLKLEIANIQSDFAIQSIELAKVTRENVEVSTKNATIHQQAELFKQNLHELDQQLVSNKNQLQDAKLVTEKLNAALTAARKENYDNSDVIICIRNDFQKLLGVHKKLQDDLAMKTSQTLQAQHEKQELFMRNSWDVCEIEGFKQRELEYLSVIKKHDGVIAEINRMNNIELERCKVQADKLLKELGDLKAIRADLEHKVGFYKESLDGLNNEVQGYQVKLNEATKLVSEKADLASKMNSDYEIKLKDYKIMCENYEIRVEMYEKNLQDKNGEVFVITKQSKDLEKSVFKNKFIKEQMLQDKNDELSVITKKLESIALENTLKDQMLQDKSNEICIIRNKLDVATENAFAQEKLMQDKNNVIYAITNELEDLKITAFENTCKEHNLQDTICMMTKQLEDFQKTASEHMCNEQILQNKNDELCVITKKLESLTTLKDKMLQDKNNELCFITNKLEDLEKTASENTFAQKQLMQDKNDLICKLEDLQKTVLENTFKEQNLQDEICAMTKTLEDYERISIENSRKDKLIQDKHHEINAIKKQLEDLENIAFENTFKDKIIQDKNDELYAIKMKLEGLEKKAIDNVFKEEMLQDKIDEINSITKKLEGLENIAIENTIKDKIIQDKNDEICAIKMKLEEFASESILKELMLQDKNVEILAMRKKFENNLLFKDNLLQDKNDELCGITKKLEDFEIASDNMLKDKILQDKNDEILVITNTLEGLQKTMPENMFKDKNDEICVMSKKLEDLERTTIKMHDPEIIKTEKDMIERQIHDNDATKSKNKSQMDDFESIKNGNDLFETNLQDCDTKMLDFDAANGENNVIKSEWHDFEGIKTENELLKREMHDCEATYAKTDGLKSKMYNFESVKLDYDANNIEKNSLHNFKSIKNENESFHKEFEEVKINSDYIDINCKTFNEIKTEYDVVTTQLQDYETKCTLLNKLQGYKEQYEMKVWDYKKLQQNTELITQKYETKLQECEIANGVAIKSLENKLKSQKDINDLYELRLRDYMCPQEFDAQLNSKVQHYVNIISDYEKQLQQKVMEMSTLQSELLSTRKQLMKDTDVNAAAENGSLMTSHKVCVNDVVRLQDMVVVKNMEIQEIQKRYETNNRTLLRKIKELLNEKARIEKRYSECNDTNIKTLCLQLKHANAELALKSEMVTNKLTELLELSDKFERLELQNTAADDILKKTNEQLIEQKKITAIKDAEIAALCLQLEQYRKMTADDITKNEKEALKCAELQEALRLVTSEKYFLQRLSSDLKIALNSTAKQNQMLRQKCLGPQREPDYHSLPQLVTNLPDSINIDRINSLLNRKTKDEKPLGNLHASLSSLKRQMALLQQQIVEKRNAASSL